MLIVINIIEESDCISFCNRCFSLGVKILRLYSLVIVLLIFFRDIFWYKRKCIRIIFSKINVVKI